MITVSTGNTPTQPDRPERVLPLAQQSGSRFLGPRGWDYLSPLGRVAMIGQVGGNVAKMAVIGRVESPRQSLLLFVQMNLQSHPS